MVSAGVKAAARQSEVFRAATFNTGLAVGVIEHAPARAPSVVDVIARTPLDLLCVQEVWHDEHWRALVERTAARLPHRLRPAAARQTGHCSRREMGPVAACVMKTCGKSSATEVAACAMRSCGHLVGALSPRCAACLSRNPLRSASAIISECSPPAADDAGASPAGQSPDYHYDGSYGLGLMSAARIVASEVLALASTQNARAVIYAQLRSDAFDDLHVFCTHLTPLHGHVARPGGGSWLAEQSRQIDAMLAFIDRKAADGRAVLLLGDLNTGPGLAPGIQARAPEHYERLLAAGFANPFWASGDATCTFCSNNPLNGGSSPTGSLIDHVLVRDVHANMVVRRIWDEPITVADRARQVRSAHSDHYGLLLEMRDLTRK